MSQPISLPNMGGLAINGSGSNAGSMPQATTAAATAGLSTSATDQFSPPRHHYPIVGSPVEAGSVLTNGFAAAHAGRSSNSNNNNTTAFSPSDSSLGKSPRERARSMSTNTQQPKILTPFVPKAVLPEEESTQASEEEKITPKVLLLENVNEAAVAMFRAQGYEVDTEKGALGEEELIQRLVKGGYSAVGIRSKTKVTAKVIESVNVSVTLLGGLINDLAKPLCSLNAAHCHRLLLHRNKSSRPHRSITCWNSSIQLALLEVSLLSSASMT